MNRSVSRLSLLVVWLTVWLYVTREYFVPLNGDIAVFSLALLLVVGTVLLRGLLRFLQRVAAALLLTNLAFEIPSDLPSSTRDKIGSILWFSLRASAAFGSLLMYLDPWTHLKTPQHGADTSPAVPYSRALPKLAEALLYLFLNKEQRVSVPGDLEEEFETVIVPKFGLHFARFWYWMQVLRSVGPLLERRLIKAASFCWLVEYLRRWFRVG